MKTLFGCNLLFSAAMMLLSGACSDGQGSEGTDVATPRTVKEILAPAGENPYERHLDSAPDDACVRMRFKPLGPLRKAFNDSNYVHMGAATVLGVQPLASDADIWHLRRPVVKVSSCKEYYVDELTHSYPYLVPEAAELLSDIGRAFNDSLAARGGGAYRIKVTSVLRTPVTVAKLRRVNRNAVEESTHSYGTTFDISHSKFVCDDASAPHRTFEDLKNLLGEVLYDMREQGRCYVKYEAKQSCFHITTRPQDIPENPIPPEPKKK